MRDTATPTEARAAHARQEGRELAAWRAELAGGREALARMDDEATLAGAALGAVLAERDGLHADYARAFHRNDAAAAQAAITAGERLEPREQEANIRMYAAQRRATTLRQALDGLRRQIVDRARALGVPLEPGEEDPPPPPAGPPGPVEATLAATAALARAAHPQAPTLIQMETKTR